MEETYDVTVTCETRMPGLPWEEKHIARDVVVIEGVLYVYPVMDARPALGLQSSNVYVVAYPLTAVRKWVRRSRP